MNALSVNSITQTGYQQLSSTMAKKNAEQAEQLAETLRKQANQAQAVADQYKQNARNLDNKASKAEVQSQDLKSRLQLSNGFNKAADSLSTAISHATQAQATQTTTYSASSDTHAQSDSNSTLGSHIDVTA